MSISELDKELNKDSLNTLSSFEAGGKTIITVCPKPQKPWAI